MNKFLSKSLNELSKSTGHYTLTPGHTKGRENGGGKGGGAIFSIDQFSVCVSFRLYSTYQPNARASMLTRVNVLREQTH